MDLRAYQILADGFESESFARQAQCPICNAPGRRRHAAVNIDPNRPIEFDFRVCDRCGHGWIDPMPTQPLLDYLYARASPSVFGGFGPERMTIPEKCCANQTAALPPGNYFELGVGQGNLYRTFLARNWHCRGIDPGAWSSGLAGVVRSWADIPRDFSATVLAAMDVLEHVVNPVAVLQSMRGHAAVGGQLFCAMPNRRSARAYLQKQRWRMMRPIGHVNYFTKNSITLALRSAGFEASRIRETDLCEHTIPRNVVEIRSRVFELMGLGDQLIVAARAV